MAQRGFTGAKDVQIFRDRLTVTRSWLSCAAIRFADWAIEPGDVVGDIMGRAKAGVSDARAQAALNVSLASAVEASMHAARSRPRRLRLYLSERKKPGAV